MVEAHHTHDEAFFPKTDTDADARDERARTEEMEVEADLKDGEATGEYTVTKASGSEYTVAPAEGRCTCPDAAIQQNICKHQRRVRLAIEYTDLAAPGEQVIEVEDDEDDNEEVLTAADWAKASPVLTFPAN